MRILPGQLLFAVAFLGNDCCAFVLVSTMQAVTMRADIMPIADFDEDGLVAAEMDDGDDARQSYIASDFGSFVV